MKSINNIVQLLYVISVAYVAVVLLLLLLGIHGNFVFMLLFAMLDLVLTAPFNYRWIKNALQDSTPKNRLVIAGNILGILVTIVGLIFIFSYH